ncbi:MAG: hypothetical protein L0G52_08880, partial [Brachybacterium sp.]|nr:hypothetical protein [Brachybacterium sp.]
GEGNQPCAEVLRRLANRGWEGSVLLEVTTSSNAEVRERTLRQSLAFARHHLGHHLDDDEDRIDAGIDAGIDDEGADGDVGSTTQ